MERTIKDILHEDAVNAAILKKNDPKLKEIKNRISKRLGYENFNDFLKGNCLNNSAFVANTLEQLMDQIIFEYHDKATLEKNVTVIDGNSVGADCFAGVKFSNPQYKEQFNVIPVGRTEEASGPITLQLEIDTSSIEDFLKGVSFGIKLKK
ncbi:hypothetical protein [Elizabethkingia anophelis]|uniref:hypothetical protein n=1 Tax=Elizabethkingia anophelis TaxID=1117645 RepID=UPI001115C0A5|nr:hypothetical protein [Elizabethkingia anophelis]